MQERRTLSKNSDDIIVDGVRYVKFEGCHLFWAALNVGASDEYDIGTLFYTNTTDYTPAQSSKYHYYLENGDRYSFVVLYFPTMYDFQELIDNTNLSETVINGTTYTKFSDKKNPNKYILFPRNDGLKYSYLANQATTSLAKYRFTYNRSITNNPTLYFSSWLPGSGAAYETTKSYCTMGLISGGGISSGGTTYNYLKNSTKYTLYSYPVYVRPVIYNEEISFPCYHRVFYNSLGGGLQQKPQNFGTYIENEYDGYLASVEIYVPYIVVQNYTNSIAGYSLTCSSIGIENYTLPGQSGQSGGITNKGLVVIPNNTTNYPRELTFEITRSDGASVTFTLIQEPASS